MKTRIALMALTLALAMCVTGITMTGCGKIDYIGFDSYEGDSEGEVMSSEVTLKQALEANPDEPWFFVGEELDKNDVVGHVYYFEKGKAVRYEIRNHSSNEENTLEITLGDLSKMTKDEIIATAKKCWELQLDDMVQECNLETDPEGFDPSEEINRFMQSTDYLKDVAVPGKYSLVINTDSSGNETATEGICFPQHKKLACEFELEGHDGAYPIITGLGDGIYLRSIEHKDPAEFTYGGYVGQIYDASYAGFYAEGWGTFITKVDNPNIYFKLDAPGTEGIAVDPKGSEE